MAKSKSNRRKGITTPQALRMLKKFRAAPALYTSDEVMEIDAAIRKDTFGITRRMGMLLLTKAGSELADSVESDRGLALEVAQNGLGLRRYIECLEALLADLKAAELRSLAALAYRADSEDIVREAQLAVAQPGEVGHG